MASKSQVEMAGALHGTVLTAYPAMTELRSTCSGAHNRKRDFAPLPRPSVASDRCTGALRW
jgi:hypothetical protein